MLPSDSDAAFLWDMLEVSQRIAESLKDVSLAQYQANENLKLATERRIEIIGEAASRVSQGFRDTHTVIPWRQIIAQRNVLAHEYGDIDDGLIWALVAVHIPKLIADPQRCVPSPPGEWAG